MKRRIRDELDNITSISNIKYNSQVKQFINIYNFYEFYLKILSKFSNTSVLEFIKDYKSKLVNNFPRYNFSFIKFENKKEVMILTFNKISQFISNSPDMTNYNIYKSFIEEKIISSINTDQYVEILNIINNNISEIFNIFEILKIVFLKNNLIIYSNTITNMKKKGKIRDKNNGVKLIHLNNKWNNYIDFLSIKNNSIFIIIKLHQNHKLKQMFSDYRIYKNIVNNKITSNRLKTSSKIQNQYFKHWCSLIMKKKHHEYKSMWDINNDLDKVSSKDLDNRLSDMVYHIKIN